ncbi:HAMP domain-containing histidine kinase [bacterium]|nr:HAMP domain-containing histidine kinase [bacterium]
MNNWVPISKSQREYVSLEKKIEDFTHFISDFVGTPVVFSLHDHESSPKLPPGLYHSEGSNELCLSFEEGKFTGPNNKKAKEIFNMLASTRNFLTLSFSEKLFKESETRQSFTFLGMMVRGLGHEINNPLGILASYIQYLQLIEENTEKTEILQNMLSSVFRASDIVKQISAFGRSSPKKHSMQLVNELRNSLTLFEQIRKYRFPDIEIEIDIIEDCGIFVNRVEFQEILFSILFNSCEAYEGEGKILIKAEKYSDVFCKLIISDQGSGISPNILPLLTMPFFTTKDKNDGRGLGLTICEYLLKRNGGEMVITSTEKKGTEIQVFFLRGDSNENSIG